MKKKGFTLYELTVSIAILSFVMIGVASLLIFSAKLSDRNNKRIDTSNCVQTVIQYYKSQGKNSIIQLYGIPDSTHNVGSKYAYFNDLDELDTFLNNPSTMTTNTTADDSIMINGTTTKKYGLYIEVSKSSVLGKKPGTNEDVTISDKLKVIRIYVKVISMVDDDNIYSDMIFYKGR